MIMHPFDIQELRENIGDDRETEAALLEIFVESVAESIDAAHSLWPELITSDKGREDWHHHMHRIKGAALNLGAKRLTELALKAEQQTHNSADFEKQDQLHQVEEAYQEVADYIKTLF